MKTESCAGNFHMKNRFARWQNETAWRNTDNMFHYQH